MEDFDAAVESLKNIATTTSAPVTGALPWGTILAIIIQLLETLRPFISSERGEE